MHLAEAEMMTRKLSRAAAANSAPPPAPASIIALKPGVPYHGYVTSNLLPGRTFPQTWIVNKDGSVDQSERSAVWRGISNQCNRLAGVEPQCRRCHERRFEQLQRCGHGQCGHRSKITAARGGYVALLGNQVSSEGIISAQLGTVAEVGGAPETVMGALLTCAVVPDVETEAALPAAARHGRRGCQTQAAAQSLLRLKVRKPTAQRRTIRLTQVRPEIDRRGPPRTTQRWCVGRSAKESWLR
jgi:hypothetical protein